jgi:uncharacterized membrane protein
MLHRLSERAGERARSASALRPVVAMTSELINAQNIERAISAAAGTVLVGAGFHRGGLLGLALGGIGAGFIAQAVRGRPSLARSVLPERMRIEKAITIAASPSDLYAFWRDFENVPRFMTHVSSVRILDSQRSEWTAIGPRDTRIRWRGEIMEDRPNELISWRSVDRSPIDQRGTVRFIPTPHDGETEVHLTLEYAPPAGTIGIVVGKLLVGLSAQKMQEDLRHLKQLYETGSIPTTEGQPHGRRGKARRFAERLKPVLRSPRERRQLAQREVGA